MRPNRFFNDPDFEKLIDFIYFQVTENIDSLEAYYPIVKQVVAEKSGQNQQLAVEVTYNYIKKDYPEVLNLIETLEKRTGGLLFEQYGTIKPKSLLEVGRYEEAEKEYLKVYNEFPHIPEILQEMGALYERKGNKVQAKPY